MFEQTPVEPGYVCDEWGGRIDKDGYADAAPMYTAPPPNAPADTPEGLLDLIGALEPDPMQFIWKAETDEVRFIPTDSAAELNSFWFAHPDLRQACVDKYGYDPVLDKGLYWRHGLAEPEHANVLAQVAANDGTFSLPLVLEWEQEEVDEAEKEVRKAGVTAAGVAVRAADTGRVLMLQRSTSDGDPASGQWEFPGGVLNDGEHPYIGAKREWQEEMGQRFPRGKHVGSWQSGIYQGFVHEVPSESSVKLNLDPEDRRVVDPDGDGKETAAWWHPDHMKRSQSVRQELHDSRAWSKVSKSGGALFLISHAKTRYNRPGQPHDIVHGWKDTPLDPEGRQQARKLGKYATNLGLDEIHSSDLKRAAQTADVIGNITGVAVKKSGDYRPWNLGDFAGHSSKDVIPKLKPFMKDPSKPVDGGESFNDFTDRFLPALEKLLTAAQNGKMVGLVTHSRNIELAQGWLGGAAPRKKIDTSAITIDKLDPACLFCVTQGKSGKWQMSEVADETVRKGQARPATLHLRVHGVTKHPSGHTAYRMVTRDNHYVGVTNPTKMRAKKGDVLKIQTADFTNDIGGDFHWMNPNVESHYSDSAHSLRELASLAGGTLSKDFAPGPAGDPPPAGDSPMGTSEMPSAGTLAAMTPAATSEVPVGSTGPTLQAVHRKKPLKILSVAYMNGKVNVRVQKAEPAKQLVYGVVLEPNSLDSQDDFMLPDQVEKAAHAYLKKVVRGRASVSKLQHRAQGFFKNKPGLVPVESFVAPVDFTYDGKEMIKKGTWVMCIHCEDPDIWEDVLSGAYTGFSIGGTGIRRSMSVPDGVVPRSYMEEKPPSEWFTPSGAVAKRAKPEDFATWRDHAWEGSD